MKHRHKRPAVVSDVDGTLVRKSLAEYLMRQLALEGVISPDVAKECQKKRRAYQRREIPYHEWVEHEVAERNRFLPGKSVSRVEFAARVAVHRKGKHLHEFTRDLLRHAAEKGWGRALITGSPEEVVAPFAHGIGVEIFVATHLPKQDGYYVVGRAIDGCHDKRTAILQLAETHNFDLESSVAIGDGMADVGMFKAVKFPICFNPTKDLQVYARECGWPIVIERKGVTFAFRPNAHGRLVETDLKDVLPPSLAECFV